MQSITSLWSNFAEWFNDVTVFPRPSTLQPNTETLQPAPQSSDREAMVLPAEPTLEISTTPQTSLPIGTDAMPDQAESLEPAAGGELPQALLSATVGAEAMMPQVSAPAGQDRADQEPRPQSDVQPKDGLTLADLTTPAVLEEAVTRQPLALWEESVVHEYDKVADILHHLGLQCLKQHCHEQAKPLLERSLSLWEQSPSRERFQDEVTESLHQLAMLNRETGQVELAEQQLQQCLNLREQRLGLQHPAVADTLIQLALLNVNKGLFSAAEALLQRALEILEKVRGCEHPDVAECLSNLAGIAATTGRYGQAETYYERFLAIYDRRRNTVGNDKVSSQTYQDGLARYQMVKSCH